MSDLYMDSRKRLDGKVALITGAATGIRSSLMGFGGTTAHLFADEGATVVVSDINEKMGEVVANQITDSGKKASFIKLDVTSDVGWEQAVEATVSMYGTVDILVNCAGDTVRTNVEDTTPEMWDQQIGIHAKAAFLGAKYTVPVMRRSKGGSIVNVGSISALVGSDSSTPYHGAKGAIRSLTKALAVQCAKYGIRFNAVHPGFVLTPMTKDAFTSEALGRRLESVPMRRLGTVEEIAYGILYLASDEAAFITGVDLVIDGGMTAM